MIEELHLLLTYQCTKECDHCFVYSSPFASSKGTFSFSQIKTIVKEANILGTIKRFYFEGGEPFLFYPLLKESMVQVKKNGYEIGIVTNGYWLTNTQDAKFWLNDLVEIGIDNLSVSDDCYHNESADIKTEEIMMKIATELGIPTSIITINEPEVTTNIGKKGTITGGDVRFRGRAVEKIVKKNDLPAQAIKYLNECKFEDLESPSRVHLDAYGTVQICQGISLGNMWTTPLSEILMNYDPKNHQICGPLLSGGPIELAKINNIELEPEYVDECHLCYDIREKMRKRSCESSVHLVPDQVYGE